VQAGDEGELPGLAAGPIVDLREVHDDLLIVTPAHGSQNFLLQERYASDKIWN
jgi:hypothetical protein